MNKQAIVTKFHGPTNYRGSRITAKAFAGKLTMPYKHELNEPENHRAAAELFCQKMKWEGALIGGGMPDGGGMVFVFVD